MKSSVYGFLAETSLHPGAGQDTGLIDLPVAREKTTDYPVVFASALKGALRDAVYWRHYERERSNFGDSPSSEDIARCKSFAQQEADRIFGKPDSAGAVLVSDLRLLLLPIRSMTSSYYWVTCPHLIERCCRDRQRAGLPSPSFSFADVSPMGMLTCCEQIPSEVYLEERTFKREGDAPDKLVDFLGPFVPHADTRQRLNSQLIVISDSSFAWFARYGLAVAARNVLDTETKASKNLWYEETIPPDSLFYCVLGGRHDAELSDLAAILMDQGYLQVGGNETVGQGWLSIADLESVGQPVG